MSTRRSITFRLGDIDKAAGDFLKEIQERTLVAFYAPMGAGKTTFIKALCEQLGVTDVINSPTFAIVNEYQDGQGEPVYHFDFYRIKRPEELFDIGFEEYVDSGAFCFMEWPELVEEYLPEETLSVSITENPDGSRTVAF